MKQTQTTAAIDWNNINLDSPYECSQNLLDEYDFDTLLLEVSCNLKEITPERQERFLPLETMWQAYPFKKTGLSKHGLSVLLSKMQTELEAKGNVEIPVKQTY